MKTKIELSKYTKTKLPNEVKLCVLEFLEANKQGAYKYITEICGVGSETVKRVLNLGHGRKTVIDRLTEFTKHLQNDTP